MTPRAQMERNYKTEVTGMATGREMVQDDLSGMATPADRFCQPVVMTRGNLEMVGHLCSQVSTLRSMWSTQAARLDAQGRKIRELEAQVATLQAELRRINGRG
jgi:hypothetical protein